MDGEKRTAKILVLDDEFLIAMSLAKDLERAGYSILGPCTAADEVMVLLEQDEPAAAFLDINLGQGRTSLDLARELERREIPFLFLTGYSESVPIRKEFPNARFLSKPINPSTAQEEAGVLLNGR